MARFRFTSRLVAAAATALISASSSLAADPAGWSLNWVDEFTGTAIDSTRWERLTRRDSYNNEKQYYLANQVSVANGKLRITATNQPLDGKGYRSGLVRTWAEQTYGRWEIRASLPTTQGMWPALWLLPRHVNWPNGGEIDIMENRGSQPNLVGSAYHYGSSSATHQWVGRDFSYSVNGSPVSFHNSMHDYAVEWDPNRIRYFVDGVPHFTFYSDTAPISSSPMSLIMNLAIGGDYGGDPNGSTVFPQYLDVDSVRVYNRNTTTRALANGNFETRAGDLFAAWDEYSNEGNVRPDSVGSNARSGSVAVQMYGRYNGAPTNNSGLFQEVPATPGEVWQVGAFSRNRPGDGLVGGNSAWIKIEFIDGNGDVINDGSLRVVDPSSPSGYREAVVRRTAPANTKFVRAVLEMIQVNNANGAVNFDDAALRRATGASLAGDINLDGTRDAFDLDALLHSLAAVNSTFDYDGNSAINQSDVDALLASAFGTTRGDTDLDQRVDFDDLLTLAQNYGIAGVGSWALGDFDGDSSVDFDDLLALAQHYDAAAPGEADASAPGDSFAYDWKLAQSMVPEPSSCILLGAAFVCSRRRRANACGRGTGRSEEAATSDGPESRNDLVLERRGGTK